MNARQEQAALTTARRMDDRQRAILRALWDHQVLLTAQIKILFFASERRCQDQMRTLAEMALVEKDNPSQSIGVGRAQAQWTLTETGIQVVAVTMRKPRSALDRMPRHTWHRGDKMLEHRLGVNRFFVSLVEASLLFPDHGLQKWAPDKYHATTLAGAWIKPDGYGVYQHPGAPVTSTWSTTGQPSGPASYKTSSPATSRWHCFGPRASWSTSPTWL